MAVIGYVLAGVIILITIISLVIYVVLSPTAPSDMLSTEQFSLSKSQSIVTPKSFSLADAADSFLKNGTGTYSCFVYLDNLLRTSSADACGSRPSQPSCSSGLYDPCKCNAFADCTNCVHEGYKQLFSLYGVYTLEVLNVPDASRQNSVSAQMIIRTYTGSDSFIETIPLPPIPLQKWTMISVSKEGRRISVHYNDELVSSSKVLNMISLMNHSGAIVQAGDSGLSGTITLLKMVASRLTIGDIAAFYSANVDTRGNPTTVVTTPNNFSANIDPVKKSTLFNKMCLDGSCLSLPRVGGSGPVVVPSLYKVESNYN